MAQLPRSISRIRRRLQRGKAVTLELRWTDTKLSPEAVKVVLQSESAILRRSFQPEVDLRTAGHPIEFMGFPLPPNLAAEPDLTWLKLATPGGTRYLGGRESELALIGVCARWPYPATKE